LWAVPRIIVDDSLRDAGQVGSANWSGYAATAATPTKDTVTDVIGTWTVPAVSGAQGYSAVWVGIDGFDDGTVEQLGTMQAVVASGRRGTTAEYYAWVEMYPAPMVQLPYSVSPGDTITAAVSCSGTTFTVTMADVANGVTKWSYTPATTQVTANEMSAEWVVEAPSDQFGILPLADFGTVNFTGCAAIIGASGTISAFNWDAITMEEVSRRMTTVYAQPSALSPDGSAFSVKWKNP
jgi:hypothetical protein